MNKLRSGFNTKIYFIPPLIITFILLGVYSFNGIYPFGESSICYYDMAQNFVPEYTLFWDILHGDASPLFSWNSAGGMGLVATLNNHGFFNITTLLFFLVCPRSSILDSMSFLLIVKLAFMSLSAMLFLNRKFNISAFWKIIFSSLYAISSYSLLQFTNIRWFDTAMMFPLVLLSLDYLLKKGKIVPYTLILAYTLIQGSYMAAFVYLFLLLVVWLYIFLVLPREIRKKSILNFGLGSVSALCLSSFIIVPALLQTFSSSRAENSKTISEILNAGFKLSLTHTGMVLILSSLQFAFLLILILNFKKNKRICTFFIVTIFLLSAPALFESINLIWHAGSYILFTMRYAYMLVFILIVAAAYSLENFSLSLFKFRSGISTAAIVLAIISFLVLVAFYFAGVSYSRLISISFILTFFSFSLLLFFSEKKIACFFISVILLFNAGIHVSNCIAPRSNVKNEFSVKPVEYALEIKNKMALENDRLSRVRNPDTLLSANYPFMLNYPAISNYTHLTTKEQLDSRKALGYVNSHTRLLDSGGTAFTDALFNIKNSITTLPLSEPLYKKIQSTGMFDIYEHNYSLPFGLLFDGKLLYETLFYGDEFEINNKLFRSLSGSESSLFEIVDAPAFDSKTGEALPTSISANFPAESEITYHFFVEGQKQLYFSAQSTTPYYSMNIYVNGRIIDIPSTGREDNQAYPAIFNSAIIDLGAFNNEDVCIEICFLNANNQEYVTMRNSTFALMDISLFSQLSAKLNAAVPETEIGSRDLEMTVEVEENNNVLFLPVTYSEGWECSVNGENAEIVSALGGYCAIVLGEGENHVKMKFTPVGLNAGILISCFGFALLIALEHWRKKRGERLEASSLGVVVLEKVYFIGCALLLFVTYIIPIAYTCLNFLFEKQ